MKRFTVFLIAMACLTLANAQQVATLQSAGTTSIYNNTNPLIDAYNAAINGDTILLSGGAFALPTNFAKGITIIGAGIGPDSTTATLPTMLTGNFTIGTGADSLYVEGVQITGTVQMAYNVKADFVSFVRCHLQSLALKTSSLPRPVAATNFSLIQCIIIGNLDITSVVSSLISNSIFQGYIVYSVNNTYQNNILLTLNSTTSRSINSSANNIFSNNIFVGGQNYVASGSSSNFFQNNIFVATSPDFGATPMALNNYTGVPTDSIFINQTGNAFNFAHNYHLKPNAASIYLGYDNSPVGMYGGFMPVREGWVPLNPHISFKQIPSVTNNQGMLNIQVKARAQQP